MITLTLDLPDNAEDLYEAANNGASLVSAIEYHVGSWLESAKTKIRLQSTDDTADAVVASGITKFKSARG